MSSTVALLMTFGPVAIAALLGIVFDMLDRPRLGAVATAILLLGAGVAAVVAAWSVAPESTDIGLIVGGAHSATAGAVLILAGFGVLADSRLAGALRAGAAQRAALTALGAGGAALAAATSDLLIMLVAIEMTAVCAYGLVSAARTPESSEAALKYFIQGAVATGLFVLGLAILVGIYGPSTSAAELSQGIGLKPPLELAATVGVLALIAALAFKVGAAPMHAWAPDAYETAPASAAATLAGSFKIGMAGALSTAVATLGVAGAATGGSLGPLLVPAFGAVGALAITSVAVGSLVALQTRSYRRMLAYAGVAQVGYVLIALGALSPAPALVMVVTYGIATTAAFVASDVFSALRPEWDGSIAGLAGLGREHPAVGAAVGLTMFSLAGVPPLVGFWGKLQSFAAALQTSSLALADGQVGLAAWMGVLALVGVVGSVVSIAYYGNVVRVMIMDDAPPAGERSEVSRRGPATVLLCLAAVIVVLGVAPLIFGLTESVHGFLLN